MESNKPTKGREQEALDNNSDSGKLKIRVTKEIGERIQKAAMINGMSADQIVAKAIGDGLSILSKR